LLENVILKALTGGTGLEAARGLAEAGCGVALFCRQSKNADDLIVEMVKETGKEIRASKCYVSSKDSITTTVDKI
jgi:NAD(P)-dependent dehydrogenase (short-subunit alcohol dehydrogenase family)